MREKDEEQSKRERGFLLSFDLDDFSFSFSSLPPLEVDSPPLPGPLDRLVQKEENENRELRRGRERGRERETNQASKSLFCSFRPSTTTSTSLCFLSSSLFSSGFSHRVKLTLSLYVVCTMVRHEEYQTSSKQKLVSR